MAFELLDAQPQGAVIKVVGVGGCGGNAIDHMIEQGVQGVEFITINTDAQALKRSKARVQLQIGANLTKGLGAGAKPQVGEAAAIEDRDRIAEIISGANMVFITAGWAVAPAPARPPSWRRWPRKWASSPWRW